MKMNSNQGPMPKMAISGCNFSVIYNSISALQEDEYLEVDTERFADCDAFNSFWIAWNNTGKNFN